METQMLGTTDLAITPLGLGAWSIGGGGWQYGWGHSDDRSSIATIHRALDQGMNWIDTAPIYGVGHSEEVVGRALQGRANRPLVFTKCGLIGDKTGQGSVRNVLKADSIRTEVEESLRRLRIDVIDLYQMHWPNPDADIEEAWTTMAELQARGYVRYIGVSNFTTEQLRRAQRIAPVASLQPPYALLRREIEQDILPFCAEQQIGVIVYSPMMSGLLSGTMTRERIDQLPLDDWRRRDAHYQEPQLSRNLALVELLRTIGLRYDRTPAEIAIAWTLRMPAVTGAIVGARRPEQIDGLIGAASFRVSATDLAEIEAFFAQYEVERTVGSLSTAPVV